MNTTSSPGGRFRAAMDAERPLQLVGVINAYAAIMAQSVGFRAVYLSGAGVANASRGLPDLGMTTLSDVLEDARRITFATSLPLIADVDTGWGSALMIARTIRELGSAGAAGVHIEDQGNHRRCGHRPGKVVVGAAEMVDRLKAAVDARSDPDFVIIARTDAYAIEGLEATIDRAGRYQEAGADIIFPEALTDLEQYRKVAEALAIPVLANMTEFGLTPLFDTRELAAAGVRVALYPLSAWRAMNRAALDLYASLRREGTQKSMLAAMQTRKELYDLLGYEAYEQQLDQSSGQGERDDQ